MPVDLAVAYINTVKSAYKRSVKIFLQLFAIYATHLIALQVDSLYHFCKLCHKGTAFLIFMWILNKLIIEPLENTK